MIVEREGVVYGTSRGAVDAFARVVRLPERRIIAVADGHTCGWDGGVEAISAPVLDSVERALEEDPTAPVESLFEAARAAFLLAAEPYPEDEDVGGPAAQLTIAEISPGRLRVGRLGRLEVMIAREGGVHHDAERPGFDFMRRAPSPPSLLERPLLDGDLILVSSQWITDWTGEALPLVAAQLSRAHPDPRSLVEAAIARWRHDVRQQQEIGRLIGEPGLVFAAVRAEGAARERPSVRPTGAPGELPWKLDRGLYLEDCALLLPWGIPFEELRALGGAEVLERETSAHLSWRAHRALGGLPVHAHACRIHEEPNPRAYHIHLPELHWIALDLLEVHADPAAAHRQLRRLHDHLAAALGPATFSYPRYSRKLPGIFWERPPLLIGAGPQYGATNLRVTIAHTPAGYAELRAEAARIREQEGEGARVDRVAWYAPFDE